MGRAYPRVRRRQLELEPVLVLDDRRAAQPPWRSSHPNRAVFQTTTAKYNPGHADRRTVGQATPSGTSTAAARPARRPRPSRRSAAASPAISSCIRAGLDTATVQHRLGEQHVAHVQQHQRQRDVAARHGDPGRAPGITAAESDAPPVRRPGRPQPGNRDDRPPSFRPVPGPPTGAAPADPPLRELWIPGPSPWIDVRRHNHRRTR